MTWLDKGGIRGHYGRSGLFPLLVMLMNFIAFLFFPGTGTLFMMPALAATAFVNRFDWPGVCLPCTTASQVRPSPIERRGLCFMRWAADIEAAPFRASVRSLWLGDVVGDID